MPSSIALAARDWGSRRSKRPRWPNMKRAKSQCFQKGTFPFQNPRELKVWASAQWATSIATGNASLVITCRLGCAFYDIFTPTSIFCIIAPRC